jgi:hypothetical protein
MKHPNAFFLPLVMTLIAGFLNAQEDSIKIQQINIHTIVNGKQTSAYFTKNQKTLSMDEQPIREVNFNDSTKQIQDYTFYFYRNGKLFSEENYTKNDSPQFIIKHAYNTKGQEEEIIRLSWIGGKPVQSAKTTFLYDENGSIIGKKEYKTGKKPYRITSYLNSSGNLVKEQCKTRKSPDNIILRTIDYQYYPDGKLKLKNIREKNTGKVMNIITETYLYNDKGNLEKIEVRDPDGQIVLIKNYVYYPEGGLYRYFEQNKEGNMVCYHTFAYRKHKIKLGTQKSYFDNQ